MENFEKINEVMALLPSNKWLLQFWYGINPDEPLLVEHRNGKAWMQYSPGRRKWEKLTEGQFLKIKNTPYYIERRKQTGIYGR